MTDIRTTPTVRKLAVLTLLTVVSCLASLVLTQPAHAANRTTLEWRNTSECPCYLSDERDGTEFLYDKGGEAAKIRVYDGTWLRAKAEFHPYDEKLWLYNTTPVDSNVVWVISWPGGREVYDGPSRNAHRVIDLDIDEGDPVTIAVYEHRVHGQLRDRLGGTWGTA